MINLSLVLERFMFYTELTEEEAQAWRPTLKAMTASLEHRLKEDVDSLEYEQLLAEAVAADGYYRYCLRKADGEAWVTAGSVQVKVEIRELLEAAERLRYEAMLGISHLLGDRSFMFRGI